MTSSLIHTHMPRHGEANARTESADLYDRLERALIALEYALADARSSGRKPLPIAFDGNDRSQEALQSAGEELQDVLLALRTAALRDAAIRAQQWS